jgi:hypothetical protein
MLSLTLSFAPQVVAVVDVGLAPERGYPYSTEAGLEAVDWLLSSIEEGGGDRGGEKGGDRRARLAAQVDPARILIGGAGG